MAVATITTAHPFIASISTSLSKRLAVEASGQSTWRKINLEMNL
jgi:hypothetical protein